MTEAAGARQERLTVPALLGSILMASLALSYEAPLVVSIAKACKISEAAFGSLQGLTSLVIAVSGMGWGYAADLYPRIRLILASGSILVACLVLSGVCFQFHLPYAAFFAVRIAAGIGFGGVGPIVCSAIMDAVSLQRRGEAFGWVGIGWALGGALGMLAPAGCVQLHLELGPTYFIGAAIALGLMFPLWFVHEPRRGSQEQALQDTVGSGLAEYQNRIRSSDLKILLAKPFNLLVVPAMIFYQLPAQVLAIWFITFMIHNHGTSEWNGTLLQMICFIGLPFGNAIGGALTDRAFQKKRTGRLTVMIALTAAVPVFLAAAMLLPFSWAWFIPLMIAANFFMAAGGPGLTAAALEVNLPEHRGTMSALMNIWSVLARAAAWWLPPLIAAAYGGRYERAFLAAAAAYLPLILTYWLMARRVEPDLMRLDAILEERAKELS